MFEKEKHPGLTWLIKFDLRKDSLSYVQDCSTESFLYIFNCREDSRIFHYSTNSLLYIIDCRKETHICILDYRTESLLYTLSGKKKSGEKKVGEKLSLGKI